MAVEQYANNAATTLNGGINAVAGSLIVASATGFPATAPYRVRIESELLIVTAGAGTTTWTVTRGAEGTTGASHGSGQAVVFELTRDGLKSIGSVVQPAAVRASRPSPFAQGTVFYPTDGVMLEFDDSQDFDLGFGPIFPLTPPVDAQFAWINQGDASIITTQGGLLLKAPAQGSGANLRIRKKTAPSVPYTITAFFMPLVFNKDLHGFGLCFRDGSGNLHLFEQFSDGTRGQLRSGKRAGPTSALTSYQSTPVTMWYPWMRIVDDNTNRLCQLSPDGQTWFTFHSVGRTDFLTATEVGFFVNPENSATPNIDVTAHLLSWRES